MMNALFTLLPSESKRLIAKGVAKHSAVIKAFSAGKIIISGGTTNAYIAEELTGRSIPKARYTAGIITDGRLCTTPGDMRIPPLCIEKGVISERSMEDLLNEFGSSDVFIKGANAVDHEGNAGVFMAHPRGGTLWSALTTVYAVGATLIVPVGLEKMIPSVRAAAGVIGSKRLDLSIGLPSGFMPIMGASVITEVETLKILFGVDAVHVGSGGVGGSEGAVTLAISGDDRMVEEAVGLVEEIKGEKPVEMLRRECDECGSCRY